jgi:hypothetical protein
MSGRMQTECLEIELRWLDKVFNFSNQLYQLNIFRAHLAVKHVCMSEMCRPFVNRQFPHGNRLCHSAIDFVIQQQNLSFGNRICHLAIDFVIRQDIFRKHPSAQSLPTQASYPGALNFHAVAWRACGNFCSNSANGPNQKMAATRTVLFSRFQDAFRDIIRQLSNSELDEDGVGSIIFRLEQCNVDLMNNQTERLISNTIMLLRNYKNVNRQASSFQLERNLNGKRGRPRFSISSEQLQYLLNYDLTCQQPDIAQSLGVSRSTLFRPIQTYAHIWFIIGSKNDR